MEINFKDRILSAAAYLFGIPALYIILTEKKKQKFAGFHGTQAFYLWLLYFMLFFAVRFVINWVWQATYIPWLNIAEIMVVFLMIGYTLYCAFRCLGGQFFRIPQ
jgi:uncharacterized membrane protein